jgi:hypothetical protein
MIECGFGLYRALPSKATHINKKDSCKAINFCSYLLIKVQVILTFYLSAGDVLLVDGP